MRKKKAFIYKLQRFDKMFTHPKFLSFLSTNWQKFKNMSAAKPTSKSSKKRVRFSKRVKTFEIKDNG